MPNATAELPSDADHSTSHRAVLNLPLSTRASRLDAGLAVAAATLAGERNSNDSRDSTLRPQSSVFPALRLQRIGELGAVPCRRLRLAECIELGDQILPRALE